MEPGAELAVTCMRCDGAGCPVCGNGWIELLGCGMVHPAVLENCGYDPERYTGFAFGLGIDRVALLKYRIPDIRLLVDGDIRFLAQFESGPMKVSLTWLREFVPIELDAEELAARIDARGVKVEGIERPWAGLDGVVVATVREVRDHPNSEKLCLATVDAGDGPVQVVVGIRNMAPGDLVPWAKPGSRVPLLDEPLGARSLRGEMSNGMLCSPRELAIARSTSRDPAASPGPHAGRRCHERARSR